MKKILLCLSLIFQMFADPYTYSIIEHPYRFSTDYEMQGKNGFEGRAIKKKLAVQTSYELYDAAGNYEGYGTVQILSLGAIFAWAKDIDVYDAQGQKIGFIDGQALTTASAKYTFYDGNDVELATAYLDYGCNGFVVSLAQGQRTIANLRRNFVEHVSDFWDVTLFEPGALDTRLLKVFSAFALDNQAYFKEDK
jgi:hypothetical protein